MAVSAEGAGAFRFGRRWRGYATAEVDSFRDLMIESLSLLESELADMKAQESSTRLAELDEAKEGVTRAFIAAARTKREMLLEAEAEATRIRADAVAAFDEAQRDAVAQAAQVRQQAHAMLAETEAYVAETRAAVEVEEERLGTRLGELLGAVEHVEAQVRRALSIDKRSPAPATQSEATSAAAVSADQAAEDPPRAALEETRVRNEALVGELLDQRWELEQRLGRMRTAVRDLEVRLGRLAEGALIDLSMVGDLIDLEATGVEDVVAPEREGPQAPDRSESVAGRGPPAEESDSSDPV